MLKNHFTSQEAPDKRLYLDNSDQSALIYLNAVFIIIVILLAFIADILPSLRIILSIIVRYVLMLLLVRANHHLGSFVFITHRHPIGMEIGVLLVTTLV